MLASRKVRASLSLTLAFVAACAGACSATPSGGQGGSSATSGGTGTGGATTSGGASPGGSTSGGATVTSGGASPTTGGAAPTSGGSAPTTGGAAPTTGGSGTGGAAGGSAGATGSGGSTTMLKGPVVRGDKCVLEFGDLFFEVTPAVAGRITAARLGAMDVLSPASVNAKNYGSTFWTSPQADWSWPPLVEVDSAPYTSTAGDNSCTLVGPKVVSPTHPMVDSISVIKTFTADFAKNAVLVDYVIKNEGTASKRIAPWEITRVIGGGLTFYASDATPTKAADFPISPTTTGAGAYWFKHSASVGQTKLFSDGKGWIAHVTPQNLILIKAFTDVPAGQAAPGEAEIEIYSAPTADGSYVEVENQGPIGDIAAGASMKWTVRWYVRALPANVMATPGNADLVTFVTQTIQ